jgi:hypothetical protein
VFCVILFSIHYIESSQIAAVEYLRLSLLIYPGVWHQLSSYTTDREELKRKHETIKPPGAVSLQLVSLHPIGLCCVLDLLQQTILKHARVRSDEFGGRHAVSRHDSVRLNIFRFSFSLSLTSVACVLLCSASSTLFFLFICHCLYATLFVVYIIIIIISCR